MSITARGFESFFRGSLSDFTGEHRIWPAGVHLIVNSEAGVKPQFRVGDGLNEFSDLSPVYEQDMSPSAKIAIIGTTVNLPATAASYADLAAARTSVEALRAAVEARLDVIEAKDDALITALIASGEMLAS